MTTGNTGYESSLDECLNVVKLAHLTAGQPSSAASQAPKARFNLKWVHDQK